MSVYVTVVLLASLHYVLPLDQEIFLQPEAENPFDAGPVGACWLLQPEENYCNISYRVPAPIARLREVIEYEIMDLVESEPFSEECKSVIKEARCIQKFPSCSADHSEVTFSNYENCEQRLAEACNNDPSARRLSGAICGNSNATRVPAGSCQDLSSYYPESMLQHCSMLDSNFQVSNWMYQHIKNADIVLVQESLSLGSNTECWEKYQRFFCGFVGQCVGDNVELVNTYERCQELLSW